MTATGFAWFAGNFVTTSSGWLVSLSTHALFLWVGPLIHLAVTFPRGRARGASDRVAVAGGYAISLAPGLWQRPAAAIGIALVLAAVGTFDLISSPRSRRREQLAAWCATAFVALVVGVAATIHLASAAPEAKRATLLFEQLSLSALAGLLLVALLSRPWEQTEIADLVVELGESRSGAVRTALAEALGDASLQVGYWSAPAGGYVDEAGRRLAIPNSGSGHEVTHIERDGRRVAVLVHEPGLLDEPAVAESLAEASRLTSAYAHLHAAVREQLTDLHASRLRLLRAGDSEQRRLQQRAHDGAEQVLLGLGPLLAEARKLGAGDPELVAAIVDAEQQLSWTLDDLHRLSRGLHPQTLAEHGLTVATAALADDSPVPVELRIVIESLPAEVEAAIYFVCSEGLANIAKYAAATSVRIDVSATSESARIEVTDDGVGGAETNRGSGLRGLSDRFEALGGTLYVESPPGRGTRLVAEVPLT